MAEVKWIKLSTEMFDNKKIKKIRRLPSGDQILIVWLSLLTMAGKCNAKGYIFITENVPYEAEDIAEDLGYDVNIINLALDTFKKLEMIIIEDTGLIYVEDWEGHQSVDRMEKMKEQNKIRQQRYREKNKDQLQLCNKDVTLHNATDKIREDKKEIREEKEDIKQERINYASIKDYWNHEEKLPQINTLSQKRKDKIKLRINEIGEIDFLKAIYKLNESSFCTGKNDRKWRADIDWLIANDNNIVKVLEGRYDDDKKQDQIKTDGFKEW